MSEPYEPPQTYEELIALDQQHRNVGLGDMWMVSKRRAEILRGIRMKSMTMRELPDGHYRVPVKIEGGRTIGSAVVRYDVDFVVVDAEINGEAAKILFMEPHTPFSIAPVFEDKSLERVSAVDFSFDKAEPLPGFGERHQWPT